MAKLNPERSREVMAAIRKRNDPDARVAELERRMKALERRLTALEGGDGRDLTRDERKARGFCTQCGGERDRDDRQMCYVCRENRKLIAADRKARGV